MKNSLALKILRGIGVAGLVIVAANSPYFGLGLIRGLCKRNNRKTWRKFYWSLNYLNRRGYARILESGNGFIKVRITKKGEDVIRRVDIDSLELKRQEEWDGKWRVIAFDVPVSKNKNRLAFTEKIKELGFIMVQKSLWAYPYECHEELAILRKFYGVEKCVSYFQAVEVEDEKFWRTKFNLGHKAGDK